MTATSEPPANNSPQADVPGQSSQPQQHVESNLVISEETALARGTIGPSTLPDVLEVMSESRLSGLASAANLVTLLGWLSLGAVIRASGNETPWFNEVWNPPIIVPDKPVECETGRMCDWLPKQHFDDIGSGTSLVIKGHIHFKDIFRDAATLDFTAVYDRRGYEFRFSQEKRLDHEEGPGPQPNATS